MEPKSHRHTPLVMLTMLALLLLLGVYTAGYFWLGSRNDWKSKATGAIVTIERSYGQRWLAILFRPAGWIEQRIRGVEVDVRAESSIRVLG